MKCMKPKSLLMYCHRFLLISLLYAFMIQNLYAAKLGMINFGVLSLAPPSKIYTKWKPFADYLSQETGRPVKIVAPRGFGKLKKMAQEKKWMYSISIHTFFIN